MYPFLSKLKISGLFLLSIIVLACSPKEPVTSVEANGEKIVFTNDGQGETAIVFVHGYSNTKEIWETQIAHFSEEYQVIAIDLPGFGESSHNKTKWTMEALGADVNAVISELGLKNVVLVGFSMGAPVVLEAASLNNEAIIGIVLVDSIKDLTMQYPDEMIAGIVGMMNGLLADPSKENLVAGKFFTKNYDASTARVMSMLETNVWQESWNDCLVDLFKWFNSGAAVLENINVPMSVINTDVDPTNESHLKSLNSDLEVHIVEGSGHCIMWDFPDLFNELIEKDIVTFKAN